MCALSLPTVTCPRECHNISLSTLSTLPVPFQSLSAAAKSLQRQGGSPLLLLEVKPSVLAVWAGADPEAFVVSQSETEAAQLIDDRGKVVT